MGNTFPLFEIPPEEDELLSSLLGQEREPPPTTPQRPGLFLSSPHSLQSLSPLTWRLHNNLMYEFALLQEDPGSPNSSSWLSFRRSLLVPGF